MRRVTCTLRFQYGNALIDLLIGQIQAEVTAQHVVVVGILLEPTLVGASFRVTHRDARVVHSGPRPIRSWLRNNNVGLGRSVSVCARIPGHDRVFAVVSRIWNGSVEMRPTLL